MQNIYAVFSTIFRMAQTRLSFPPFSFTILDFAVALALGGIIVSVVRKFFN